MARSDHAIGQAYLVVDGHTAWREDLFLDWLGLPAVPSVSPACVVLLVFPLGRLLTAAFSALILTAFLARGPADGWSAGWWSFAVIHQHQGPDDGAAVLGMHVQLLPEGLQRHLQVLDERLALVLGARVFSCEFLTVCLVR